MTSTAHTRSGAVPSGFGAWQIRSSCIATGASILAILVALIAVFLI